MKKMKKQIVAGTVIALFLIVIAGIALVVSSKQLYPEASEAAEVEGEGYGCGGKTSDSPSDSGIRGYLNGVIEDYRSGQSDCGGGTGSWQDTKPCLENAIIRWSGESLHAPAFSSDIEGCYWRWSWLVPTEHCYTDWDGGSQDDPVYYTYIGNEDLGFYHAVCAEYEGGGMSDFDNWRFFQYLDTDIVPDDSQMPCGTDTHDTYVKVKSTNDISCGGIVAPTIYAWNIDENCDVSSRKVRLVHVTDEDVAGIKSEIEELRKVPEMRIGGTAIDSAEKTVMIWVYELTPENQQLHGKMIDGWKIIVGESPKPEEPEDIVITTEALRKVIDELRKVPELRLPRSGGTAIHLTEKTVTIWVDERTPENQRLHHEMIGGWEIIIARDQTSKYIEELTAEMIADAMEGLEKMPEMQLAAWEINETEKTAIIWVYELTPENQHLGDEDTGEWKISVRERPSYRNKKIPRNIS